jgi:hypothetical protein
MRKFFAGLAALALVAVVAVPLMAATETVTGKVIDQMCYTKDKANNAGPDHKMPADTAGCALACAKMGRPMALLTTDGKVYTLKGGLAENMNAKLLAHIAHTVSITGDVAKEKDGSMSIAAAELKMVSR